MAHDWQSNILIATVGTAPSVVTETVWALLRRKPEPWVPTAIYLLTTTKGEGACERHLKRSDGELAALFASQGLPFVVPELVVPTLPDESKIGDIRTEDENIAFANDITRLIKMHTEWPDSRVHVSIAGGRKTMSSYAQAAISVFGRDQDELTHVLVSIPEFEYNPRFFYPEQERQEITITVKDPASGQERKVERLAREAEIELVPSPFIRLGYILKEAAFPGGKVSYESVVQQVQAGLEVDRIKLLCASNEVIVGRSTRFRLPARAFALYRLLGVARKEGWPGCGPEGFGPECRGWLSYGLLTVASPSGGTPLDLYCDYYVESAAASERDDAFNDRAMAAQKSTEEMREWAAAGKYRRIQEHFRNIKSDLGELFDMRVTNVSKREFASVCEKQDRRTETKPFRGSEIAYFGLRAEAGQIVIGLESRRS